VQDHGLERPTPQQWEEAVNMLMQVQRTLVASIDSGVLEAHDHHVLGLPSALEGATPAVLGLKLLFTR
jgi:hypothetical protein